MTVTLNLNPEVEKGLMARAHARGVSLDDYIQELVGKSGIVRRTGTAPHSQSVR
jgi:predicted HicB family RNase H-like nuclease